MGSQITEDLKSYQKEGISLQAVALAAQHYVGLFPHNNFELARCRIQNGEVFAVSPFSTMSTRFRFDTVCGALRDLSKRVLLSDIDFFICVGDAPGADTAAFFRKYGIPILAFAKSEEDTVSILMPDFEALLEGFFEKLIYDTLVGHRLFPWHVKVEKAFWRGGTTGGCLTCDNYQQIPRVKLAFLASQYPHLIDAKLTSLVQIADPEVFALLGPYVDRAYSVTDHLKYKYQILIDGNTCAYSRAYWQLFSGCLIFKQTSPNIQWYYKALLPYVHYIPITYELSDLKEKIEWAQHHDIEVRQIVANAIEFAHNNLKKQDIYLYLYLLLQKYAELQK